MLSSTEFIQKEEAAEKNDQRNPEVEVGGDGAEHVAGTVVFAGRHCRLRMGLLNLGCHLRGRSGESQRLGICVCDVEMYTLKAVVLIAFCPVRPQISSSQVNPDHVLLSSALGGVEMGRLR